MGSRVHPVPKVAVVAALVTDKFSASASRWVLAFARAVFVSGKLRLRRRFWTSFWFVTHSRFTVHVADLPAGAPVPRQLRFSKKRYASVAARHDKELRASADGHDASRAMDEIDRR